MLKTYFQKVLKYKKLTVVSCVSLFAVILFLSFIIKENDDERPVVSVKKGDFVISMHETAEIKAENYQLVSAPEDIRGDLQIIYLAPEGTTVAQGDTLIKFDPSGLLKELMELEDQLDVELANYEKAKISQKMNMERMIKNLDVIKYSHELSALQLELLKYESAARKEEAELNLKKAEIEIEKSKTEIESQKIMDKAELQKMEIKIEQAREKIRKTEENINSLTVTAPIPGLVVYQEHGWPTRTKYRVGDKVSRGSWIIRLPDLSKMQAVLHVNEIDRKKVWEGQKGTVFLDAYPGPVFHGEIASISTLSKEYQKDSNLKVFEIIFSIDESDPRLKPGMTACVELELETIPDALYIPVSAIIEQNGKKFVVREKPVEIETGIMNHTHAVIEKRLKENDKILSNPPRFESKKLGYFSYKEKEAERLKLLAEHFGNIEELGIQYDYDGNRGKKESNKDEDNSSGENIVKTIREKGGTVTPEMLQKLKDASRDKVIKEKKD